MIIENVMRHCLRRMLPTLLILASGSGATSCIYEGEKPCPDRLSFTIQSDWSAAPEASPGGMAYIFFPADGSELWRFDFPGREDGKVDMLVGDYRFLSYNDDTYKVLFRGEDSYDSYEAYTPETDLLEGIPVPQRGTLQPQTGDNIVVESPDMMWGCAYCGFRLQYEGVSYCLSAAESSMPYVFSPEFVLTAVQRPITARYTYRIENVENLSGVKSMSAALSGMVGSVFLASGRTGTYPSTLSVRASAVDPSTIRGQFYTFGIPSHPEAENILSLFTVLKDGRKFCYNFNVSEQVRSAPDPMNVEIILRGLTLEIPEKGESTGFDVNVDGWETVVVNING